MSTLHDAGFPADYTYISRRRGSIECSKLEARFPGIRFNEVRVDVWPLFRFQNDSDSDYMQANFSISGTADALKRHGFDAPTYASSRAKTSTGVRFSSARYTDGLDRVACLFMPELLAKFARKEARAD